MFPHPEHACMISSACSSRTYTWLIEVIDEVRFAPWVRPWDTWHNMLVQKLQIISWFLLSFCLLTRQSKIVICLVAHALVENVDIKVDAGCKLTRLSRLVWICKSTNLQLRISKINRIVWISCSFICSVHSSWSLSNCFALVISLLCYDQVTCFASFYVASSTWSWLLVNLGPRDGHILRRTEITDVVVCLCVALILRICIHRLKIIFN